MKAQTPPRNKNVKVIKAKSGLFPQNHLAANLSEIEKKYRSLFATNMIGIVLSDLDDKIIEANDAFLNLIGYTRADIKNGVLTWSRITPKKHDAIDQKKIKEILRHGTIVPFEKEYIHKRGHLVSVMVGAETISTNSPLNISFALDISEQKKLEQRKDDFISMISHELKTPLAVMKIYADLMLNARDKSEFEELKQNAEEVHSQIEKLTTLVTDLANLARIERNATKAGKDLIDARDVVKDVVEKSALAHERKIDLKGKRSALFVQGHRGRLWQVFNNLVGNAIKYSPPHRRVVVEMQKDGKYALIMVRDHGIGISKKEIREIFNRYYRTKHASAYQTEGSGVGLYISREIVKAHRGAIQVESVPGKGSTFTCRLPLAFKK